MKMRDIYDQIHRYLPDNEEIMEHLCYAENLYIEHEIKPKLENSESELKQFQKESNHTKAAECCEKIADSKIYIALKQNLNFEVIDEGIEHYHNAAENYKKAGQVGKAVRCYEKAVSIRQALVKSIENTEKNSHLLDVANARLGYSYLMAAEAEDSERKGSMRKRLTTFSDGCLKNILIMRTSKNSGIGWEHIYSLLED